MSIDGAHYYPRNNRARVTFWSCVDCEASAKTFMENLEWFRDHKEFCRHAPQRANQIPQRENQIPQRENPIPPIQEPSRYNSKLFFFCVIVLCLFFLSKFYYDNYINVRPKCFWDYSKMSFNFSYRPYGSYYIEKSILVTLRVVL